MQQKHRIPERVHFIYLRTDIFARWSAQPAPERCENPREESHCANYAPVTGGAFHLLTRI